MKLPNIRYTALSAATLLCLGAGPASAILYVTVQPNGPEATANGWIITASWDTLAPTSGWAGTNAGYDLEDSITGNTLTSPTVRFARNDGPLADTATEIHWNGTLSSRPTWNDIGEWLTVSSIYNNKAFASGHGNVGLISGGPAGVYLDKDGGDGSGTSGSDDFALIVPFDETNPQTNQTFVIEGVIATGDFNNIFVSGTNTGTGIELVVTDDHTYTPTVIPEPTSIALLGLSGFVFLRRRRR